MAVSKNVLKYSSQSSIFSEVDLDKDFSLIAIAGYFSQQTREYAIAIISES